jgi:hypothetical protein
MAIDDRHDKQPKQGRASSTSTTSPPGGRTDKATKPPGGSPVNREAVEKGWAALDLAAGGH